jgi:hypothetical protein
MELNITKLFNECEPGDLSASQAELGANAGAITWGNSLVAGIQYQPLDDDDKRAAFRTWVRGSGGWSQEEIDAWSDAELNALCVQWIAGDMREAGLDAFNPDWDAYELACEAGTCPSNIMRGNDGEIYFYIGS